MTREKLQELPKDEIIEILLAVLDIVKQQAEKIAELESRLNQNSKNSSKPPSSDGFNKPQSLRERSMKKPGGQKGHKGNGLKIEREPDNVIEVQPIECPECTQGLINQPMFHSNTKYVYDVEIKVVLNKYEIQETICPNCGVTVVGQPPEDCKGTINYSSMIRALSIVMTNYGNVSIDKTHKILNDLLGVPISSGTVKNIQSQFAQKTVSTIEEIKQKLHESPVLNVDETGARVAGSTQWMHVVSNSKYTLVSVHKKRGKEGSEASGVLTGYTGTLVHDCWKPYFGFDECKHALCCAHLLRELNALIEKGFAWAMDMKALLLEMKSVVERYKNNEKEALSRYYREKFQVRYAQIINNAKATTPISETRKKSKAENLIKRLEEYYTEIILFSIDFDVPFDNNQAERDIRNLKVKQKVSGCFRTEDGAKEYTNTASVIGTAVKCKQSVLT